jgi:KipI family sensor histidine kinase inhibitor
MVTYGHAGKQPDKRCRARRLIHTRSMRLEPCGETLWILRDLHQRPSALADAIMSVPGVLEAYAAYSTVGIRVAAGSQAIESIADAISKLDEVMGPAGRDFTIPVCYEMGQDLDEVSATLGLSREQVVQAHSEAVYEVAAIGFCPGFPYLSGLPAALHGLPRHLQPRKRVPLGSVAITGGQCGIYPAAVPGGWNLIGRSPVILADVREPFFALAAGDRVRFHPISVGEFESYAPGRLHAS